MTKSAVINTVFDGKRLLELLSSPLTEQQYWSLYTVVWYLSSLDTHSETVSP